MVYPHETAKSQLLKGIIPPIALSLFQELKAWGKYNYSRAFRSWEEARKCSSGYDAPEILQRVKEATIKIKSGECKMPHSWPLLAGLSRAQWANGGTLAVLDFGGSLGNIYYQYKRFFPAIAKLRWCVVEQPAFVEIGRTIFQNEELAFYSDILECCSRENINVILMSGVLQYLENPHEKIDEFLNLGIKTIIVDRTPFLLKGSQDIIRIQMVPPEIYNASLPHWFFEKSNFLKHFSDQRYRLIAEFDAIDKTNIKDCKFSGVIFDK